MEDKTSKKRKEFPTRDTDSSPLKKSKASSLENNASIAPEESNNKPGYTPENPVRLYADGIFDLFHFGHMRALEQAKKSFPYSYLMVGCCNDELTHRYKGMTVMTEEERYESLRHCKWVDEVVKEAPWVITKDFLEEHRIDFVCHDALPYTDSSGSSDDGDVYSQIKSWGKFHETQRTEGVSTSELIVRIVKDYNRYVRRNLSRGYTAKEMNVSYHKEKSIQLEIKVDQIKDDLNNILHVWEHRREEFRDGFLQMFDSKSALRQKVRQKGSQVFDEIRCFINNPKQSLKNLTSTTSRASDSSVAGSDVDDKERNILIGLDEAKSDD